MTHDPPQVPGYDVLAPLGSGGSAQVWRARRLADDLLVAVKVVPVQSGAMSATLREASVLARVHHPHVLHLYDVLSLPGPDGRPAAVALAVQLAAGGSLAQVLAARGHLTVGELVTVLAPLAGALSDLHRVGVIHGDVSAGNVLFLSDGMPMLADLGLCRVVGDRAAVTHGTDGMVAPELLEGLPATPESDVYALGALAWLCLVGEVPGWVGTRRTLEEVAPELPERLRELVQGCLEPEPDDRPEIEQVAVTLFGVAKPQPVELAPDADPALGLTQRLRADARAEELAALAGGAGTGQRRGVRGADGVAADGLRRGLHPLARRRSAQHRETSGGGRSRQRVAATAAVAGVLLGLAVTLGPPLLQQAAGWFAADSSAVNTEVRTDGVPSTPPGVPPAAPSAAPSTLPPGVPSAPPSTDPVPTEAPRTYPDATEDPLTDPVAVLQHLVDARAAAWTSGDPGDLAAAHAPGSPADVSDRRQLESAAGLGVRYRGLAYQVDHARVIDNGDAPAPDAALDGEETVLLEATISRSSYTVSPPSDTAAPRRDTVTVELVHTPAGWRIQAWS